MQYRSSFVKKSSATLRDCKETAIVLSANKNYYLAEVVGGKGTSSRVQVRSQKTGYLQYFS